MLRLTLILYLISTVRAQSNCSCSPLQYKMQLGFGSQCPPSNITIGSTTGISRIECSVSSNGNNLTPIEVTSYRISELDRDLVAVRVKNVQNVSLFDGDNVTFMSDTNNNTQFVSGGIQVSMTGINSDSKDVTLNFLVQYTNLCNVPPFAYGDSIGWLKFLRGMPARANTCFITTQPTSSPTLAMIQPTSSPTSDMIKTTTSPTLAMIQPTSSPTSALRPTTSPTSMRPILKRSKKQPKSAKVKKVKKSKKS